MSFVLALHRSQALKGRPRAIQAGAYLLLSVVVIFGLHRLNAAVQMKLLDSKAQCDALAKLVATFVGTKLTSERQITASGLVTPVTSATVIPATSNSVDPISPIEGLTGLGWNVISQSGNPTVINFQESRKPLPDMARSARYMGRLKGPLDVGIIEAKSISGLSSLASVANINKLRLAGNFPDISEIRTFVHLRSLDLIGGSNRNLEPIASLTQLRELTLEQPPRDLHADLSPLGSLVNLQKLIIYDFFNLTQIQPLSMLKSLRKLDLTATPVTDLSGALAIPGLMELTIDSQSLSALPALASKPIRDLHVRYQLGEKAPVDIGPVGYLHDLQAFDLSTALSVDISPLRQLNNLRSLEITGSSVSFGDLNPTIHLANPNVISELRALKKVGLAWVDIRDTNFLLGLDSLEEIYINQTRSLVDIRALGNLQALRSVQLVATSVVDISPLLSLSHLSVFTLQVTPARVDVITELRNRGVAIKE